MLQIRRLVEDWKAAACVKIPDREEGQTNVEYALILFLVAVAAASVLLVMGQKVAEVLSSVNASL